ncbi:unnamed protein product [Trichobilharzia szidati]|nr:unnamed protein product [Trichobilharzia szidati]
MLSASKGLYLSLRHSFVNWSHNGEIIHETVLPGVVIESDSTQDNRIISFLAVSPKDALLAAVDNTKQMYLYSRKDHQWSLFAQLKIHKQVSYLFFTPSERSLVIGDKSGDVYRLPVGEERPISETDLTCLCGHLSILSHLAISDDEVFLASCDRDEKIRISRFPQAYIIQSFCLGHTSFVSQLGFIPNSRYLVSAGGDGDLKVWNCITGQCLSTHHIVADELPSPAVSEFDFNSEAVVSRLYFARNDVIVCSFLSHPVLLAFHLCVENDENVYWGSKSFTSTPDNLPLIDMVLTCCNNVEENDNSIANSLIVGLCSTPAGGVGLFSWRLTMQYNACDKLYSLKWEDFQRINCISEDILSRVPVPSPRTELLKLFFKCKDNDSMIQAYEENKKLHHENVTQRHLRSQKMRKLNKASQNNVDKEISV